MVLKKFKYLKGGWYIFMYGRWLELNHTDGYWIVYAYNPFFLRLGFKKNGNLYKSYLPDDQVYEFIAFDKYIYCKYHGWKFSPNSVVLDEKINLFPDYDTQIYFLGFRDKGDHHLKIPYSEFLEEVTDIWEIRRPVEGFKFEVEPIVYLKRKGVWFVDHEKLVDEVDE